MRNECKILAKNAFLANSEFSQVAQINTDLILN